MFPSLLHVISSLVFLLISSPFSNALPSSESLSDSLTNSSHRLSHPQFKQRSTISDLLSLYSDLIPPPPSSTYHLIFTSYAAFYPTNSAWLTPANNASAALSSFYGAIASQSAQFEKQNWPAKQAMAFGANRVWINFYGNGNGALVWKDLEWVAERCRRWAERGLVGKWEGILWPEGGRGSVRVGVRVFP